MTFDTITTRHVLRFFALFVIGFVGFTEIGYQALLSILVDEGVFNSYCNESPNTDDECSTQSVILSFMFEAAVSTANCSTLFCGILCLKYDRRNIMILSGFGCCTFCLLFGFGSNWFKFVSYICISFFETGLIFPAYGIPLEYSPKYQGLIFSILIAGQDSSALVFFILKLMYENLNITFSMLFVILAAIYLITIVIGPIFVLSDRLFATQDHDKITIEDHETSDTMMNNHDQKQALLDDTYSSYSSTLSGREIDKVTSGVGW